MKLPRIRLPGTSGRHGPALPFDAEAVQNTVRDALAAARVDVRSGPTAVIAETLRRAFGTTALEVNRDNVVARETQPIPDIVEPAGPRSRARGEVMGGVYVGAAGSRSYRLYVPPTRSERPALVVMLHGCTQSPDDFAAGTRMNEIADREGFLVVYPAQSPNANGSKCWNWFRSQDQAREGGEPSLIAGIVRDVVNRQGVDPHRVFVAGLSAGGAMAVILGRTHPELFKGIGVHSGLPYAAAHDVSSAFAAMGGGAAPQEPRRAASAGFVPTIVFHGDRDTTVNVGNGAQVVAQALQRLSAAEPGTPVHSTVAQGTTSAGSPYTRTVHRDADGRPRVEHWVVHGAGHAWAGGSSSGSYTAPDGPDASEAMTRFFLAQARVAAAAGA